MARPNPLIIACLAVGVAVLGLEVAAIYRSHHRVPVEAAAPEEPDPAPPTAPPPPSALAPPAALPAPPPPAPPPAVAAAPVVPAPSAADDRPANRPQFTSPDVDTMIRTADEQVFEELAIPDGTREAIRRINEEHQQKLRALRSGEGGATVAQRLTGNNANITAFRQTRREALQGILGADTEIRFERAERAAAKRLHNQLRAEALGGGVSPAVSPPTSAE